MDKQVIEKYKEIDRMSRLKRTFHYWKKTAQISQQAKQMYQTFLQRRLENILNIPKRIIL